MRQRKTAALLALFLGFMGGHKFYLKKPVQGVFYLLFSWTLIPLIISLVESLVLFKENDEQFYHKYYYSPKTTSNVFVPDFETRPDIKKLPNRRLK